MLCSWYNNGKAVIIFQVAFASPPLALPAVATGETANYTTARVALCGYYIFSVAEALTDRAWKSGNAEHRQACKLQVRTGGQQPHSVATPASTVVCKFVKGKLVAQTVKMGIFNCNIN